MTVQNLSRRVQKDGPSFWQRGATIAFALNWRGLWLLVRRSSPSLSVPLSRRPRTTPGLTEHFFDSVSAVSHDRTSCLDFVSSQFQSCCKLVFGCHPVTSRGQCGCTYRLWSNLFLSRGLCLCVPPLDPQHPPSEHRHTCPFDSFDNS